MASKQAEADPTAGPFHSFRVEHVIRPGAGAGGESIIISGHLSPAAARDWISAVAKENHIDQREQIHPRHGVPVTVAGQLGLDAPGMAEADAAAWEQGQLEPLPQRASQRHAGGSEADGFTE